MDAADLFLGKLEGVSDPERKRKIIGATFIDVFEEEASKVGGADFLAQGTLYPDVIESVSFAGGPSVTIKSHHNVGGLPERMNMSLVEPLRELFKDEVRVLGRELGVFLEFQINAGWRLQLAGRIINGGCPCMDNVNGCWFTEINSIVQSNPRMVVIATMRTTNKNKMSISSIYLINTHCSKENKPHTPPPCPVSIQRHLVSPVVGPVATYSSLF